MRATGKRASQLHVVETGSLLPAQTLKPPAGLGPTGVQLWADIQQEYEISDPGSLCLLKMACQSADRAESCRIRINQDGQVVETRQGPKDHPLIKHETAARSLTIRTLQRLGLELEPIKPMGRPPAIA